MIELRSVNKTYLMGTTAVRALQDVSIAIEPGEFVAIVGPSGSGKSTLLHILGCLDRPDGGSYLFDGREVSRLSENELATLRNGWFGFVFQQFHLLSHLNAFQNVELPLIYAGRHEFQGLVREKIEEVGLGDRAAHLPNEMSGGERQRVAIARAVVNDPSIILADEPTGNLDSKNTEEIIALLERLNGGGKTVIMVTHELDLARHARRIVTMRDGMIVSDERIRLEPAAPAPPPQGDHHPFAGRRRGAAILADYFRQAVNAIVSHKMRAFLSMLGIMIGVGAVIAMMALGQGAKKSIEQRLKSLGSNLLMLRGGSSRLRGIAGGAGTVTRFTFGDAAAISEMKSVVKRVSGVVSGSAQIVYKNKNWNTRIEGVDYDYGDMRATVPEVGRWFTRDEIGRREKVAILGTTTAGELFGAEDPVGQMIKINRINFRVIGIAPEKGMAGPRDQDDVIYVPVTTAMYRVLGKNYLDNLFVEVRDIEMMEEAKEKLQQTIARRHRLKKDDDESFHIRDMSELQEMLTTTTNTMSFLLGSIAAISLLVGGIGIMNIMLVSVTERTREIGIRKAIGAFRKDIMTQFLIEAAFLTFSGGVGGIALGIVISSLMENLAGWAVVVTPSSIILATAFSVGVGLIFGLWPARQASMLDPIEALRYE